jgi:DNA-binding transcriptional LysR family regulator
MDMDLKQLGYFLAVVEHRSFRKAADALNISQPALSISIKRLEESLGCPLLDRALGRVVPTQFGLSLCQSTRRIKQEVKLAQDRLYEIHGLARGQVRIGVSPYAFTHAFATLIADFSREFPGIEIRAQVHTFESGLALLINDQVDFFIAEVINRPSNPHTACTALYRNPFVVVAGPQHPLAGRRGLRTADLVSYPWIYGTDMVTHVKNWRESFEDAGLEPPTAFIAGGDIKFHEKLLGSADFLGALPFATVQDSIAAGKIVELKIPGADWHNHMDIIYRTDVSMSPGAQRLFDEVLIRLSKDATPGSATRRRRKRAS